MFTFWRKKETKHFYVSPESLASFEGGKMVVGLYTDLQKEVEQEGYIFVSSEQVELVKSDKDSQIVLIKKIF